MSFLLFSAAVSPVFAQSLVKAQVRPMVAKKSSVYFEQGIFFKQSALDKSTLTHIRHHYSKNGHYERVVFDFNTRTIPTIYVYLAPQKNMVYFDIVNTALGNEIPSMSTSKFIQNLNFYPIAGDLLSFEMQLKNKGQFEIFYLDDPGRLVVDIK